MKKKTVAIGAALAALISLSFINCGDDGDGGSPPIMPTNPYPGANAKNVATNTVLAWECTDPDGDDLRYDVYLGTDSSLPRVAEDIPAPYYDPPTSLANDAEYRWRIVAKDRSHFTGGPTWSFTTAEAGGGGGGGTPKTGYAHFMPLSGGNKWVYEYVYSRSGGDPETNEYEIIVVDKFENYHGFESYLVKYAWLYGTPYVTYGTLGYDGDKCYIFTSPWWEYLIEDDMVWGSWSQTGFFTYYKLQFNFIRDVGVPAGYFKDCMQLGLVVREEDVIISYQECYAKDVGLVYYRYLYDGGTFWSSYEYKLKSYKVNPPA